MKDRTYQQIKAELEDILDWFEGSEIDLDEAVTKHAEAQKLLNELEAYLDKKSKKLTSKWFGCGSWLVFF